MSTARSNSASAPDSSTRRALTGDQRGWDLLLPRGWVTVPTDPDRAGPAIRRVLDRVLRGKPRDQLIQARIAHERALRSLTDQALAQGGQAVHVLIEPIGGVPVSASLVVARRRLDRAAGTEAVLEALDQGDGIVERDPVEVGGHQGLRTRRRTLGPVDEGPEAQSVWRTSVEYVVDLGSEGLLLLTFSTATDRLADPMVLLFDAVAGSLRSRALPG